MMTRKSQEDVVYPVFHGLSAWMSTSVSTERQEMWVKCSGEICGKDKAQFLFSEDAESEDTKSIYQSHAYYNEHLAVFHASFIDECIRAKSVKRVNLGLYLLPPKEVQDELKFQFKFSFDGGKKHKGAQNKNTDHNALSKEQNNTEGLSEKRVDDNFGADNADQEKETTERITNGDIEIPIEDLPLVSGEILDFDIVQNGCEVYHKL
ncbi:uncharacterized protein LOC106151954 [Lingula anatina]|uniref:Uncharacterized protein LOC106151954 n=1 Tax=Lingula anatina TaxID=7574 RepID=A0A1S3H3Z5_LINAN|nr:uncharacterized protein LOC106151954 [Lingula anatina]XP_013380856.1 uncharacterized protein LOC106151954 [Lingula anatina]XP_013380857.1 uncharacterized protein LOC106151954 [Lingula anatina]XP_013380858.1 uncharacterized protein LOC106151954 [Lingula anatina]XP_013380859.1 uncharacterized protein LOC106151954 [Lingula anatina]XP_013380860.1 uncharacterized protein LOC106151954 [Lingula anatina]|eukprot:XP_013380855.1 uncharacterized protein LOC106151954 [Lingula anatina]